MNTDNMNVELNAALTKVETEFGLSEILHRHGVSKNELITIEFKHDNKTLFVSQRAIDSASVSVDWKTKEDSANQQTGKDFGQEVAEVFSRADVLSTFRSVLQGRSVSISAENPVIVEIRRGNGVRLTSLRCPCPDPAFRCCQM